MSVAIGASRHRRARLHRDGEPGPAVHGRGALQRLRPRAADRDDRRQPRDRRADQHLERPQRLDVAARLRLDPALRRDQPGGARPAHPGLPAGRGAVDAGDGLHGRLHPHARRRARRRARAGAGRRVPAAVRATPGARPRRAGLDRRDGRSRGVHGGQVPRPRQADAGARADPRDRRRFRAGVRPRLGRPDPHLPHRRTPRRSSSRSARCSGRSRTSSTSCASRASRSARVGITSFRPFPLDAVRDALGHAQRVVVLEKALAVGIGGIVTANVRMALAGIAAPRLHGDRRTRRTADHEGLAARAVRRGDRRSPRAVDLPRHGLGRREPRAGANGRLARVRARTPRTSCATSGRSRPARYESRDEHDGTRRSASTRPAASRSATACSIRSSARCRPTSSGPTRSPAATAPARAAARRSARATRSTRRCAPPTGG